MVSGSPPASALRPDDGKKKKEGIGRRSKKSFSARDSRNSQEHSVYQRTGEKREGVQLCVREKVHPHEASRLSGKNIVHARHRDNVARSKSQYHGISPM